MNVIDVAFISLQKKLSNLEKKFFSQSAEQGINFSTRLGVLCRIANFTT